MFILSLLKNKIRVLFLVLVFCAPWLSAQLTMTQKGDLQKMLYAQLEKATTPEDSLKILYNLFDISRRIHHKDLGMMIFDLAKRTKNSHAQNDILRQMGNTYLRVDTVYSRVQAMANTLPDTPERKETITFLNAIKSNVKVVSDTDMNEQQLHEVLTQFSNDAPKDPYKRFELLYKIVVCLCKTRNQALTEHYFSELVNVVEELPSNAFSIRNNVYVLGSTIYNRGHNYEKAIECDRKLLAIMDSLENTYKQHGRIYRNYDSGRFMRYTTLMNNYPALSSEEIEEAYDKVKYYASRDSDASLIFREKQQATINYLMSKKRYAEVLPMLNKQVDEKWNAPRRNVYLHHIIEASDSLNEAESYKKATNAYIAELESQLNSRSYERYRELQILYDVYNLRAENDRLELEKRHGDIKSQQRIILFGVISFFLLIGLLLLVFRLYHKAKRLSKNLIQSNEALLDESSNLKAATEEITRARDEAQKANRHKTDVLTNICNEAKIPLQAITEYSQLIVDCTDGEKKNYLERFSKLVELNADLLNALLSDVKHLSQLDSSTMELSYRGARLNEICRMAVETVRHRLQDGVTINFEEPEHDTTIGTDPHRVDQVLINLLANAAKFTSKGSITLSYTVDQSKNRVTFNVKDTGIGVPENKKDEIFKRFVKLDKSAQGAGLGLTIAQMIARLLGGDVVLDTTYQKGASFNFFIPMSE